MSKLRSDAYCTIRMLACLVWLAAPVVADDTNQPYLDSPLYKSKVLDRLEAKLDSLRKDNFARIAPTLAELLERQEPTLDGRVLQLLTKADLTKCSEPRQLVESVSRLLDDPEQATLALAVDVLCNIGATAIAATTTRLKSPSPRVRACSTVALIRLGELSETDAIEISHDADARARVATIAALGKTQAGTNVLIAMLSDERRADFRDLKNDEDWLVVTKRSQASPLVWRRATGFQEADN